MGKRIVVGLGEILWDIFPERKVLGGAPANFAYHSAQLGFDGYAVSAVGKDDLGEEILDTLSRKGLKHVIEQVDFPTGTVLVALDGRGVPTYEITEDVAWDNMPFSDRLKGLAVRTQVVCFGSLAQRSHVSRDIIRRFLQAMPSSSLKIFDINLRQHFYTQAILKESFQMSNILKINDEELLVVAEMFGMYGSECEVCRCVIEQFDLDMVILTKGVNGSLVVTTDHISEQPTPKVHVADTVGAGDAFTAAFTAGYLNGMPLEEAHQFAAEVAAYVCQQHGAMPVLADSHREWFQK